MKGRVSWLDKKSGQSDGKHFCQLHQNESSLIDAVIRYLQVALASGENAVIITRPNRRERIVKWLTAKRADITGRQRIFIYSDNDIIEAVFEDGKPSWERFHKAASQMLEQASWSGEKKVSLYGDAVSSLWLSGSHEAAVELERLWNRFRHEERYEFSVFCGYLIEALNPLSYSEHLEHLCLEHEFVIPAPEELELRCALDEAARHILGSTLSALHSQISRPADQWQSRLPQVFRFAMWLKKHHPSVSDRLLQMAKEIYQKGSRELA